MELNVGNINQMASGGSYVVIYDADLVFADEPRVVVEVEAVERSFGGHRPKWGSLSPKAARLSRQAARGTIFWKRVALCRAPVI